LLITKYESANDESLPPKVFFLNKEKPIRMLMGFCEGQKKLQG
jgi:hypothetical protein